MYVYNIYSIRRRNIFILSFLLVKKVSKIPKINLFSLCNPPIAILF